MTHMTLQRSFKNDDFTIGALQIEGVDHRPIFTLENPWLNNKPWISSIPAGDYCLKSHKSPRHGACYKLYEVEGRTDILIHKGNFESKTSGCLLFGLGLGMLYNKDTDETETAILQSAKAMLYFTSLIKNKSNLTITIKD